MRSDAALPDELLDELLEELLDELELLLPALKTPGAELEPRCCSTWPTRAGVTRFCAWLVVATRLSKAVANNPNFSFMYCSVM